MLLNMTRSSAISLHLQKLRFNKDHIDEIAYLILLPADSGEEENADDEDECGDAAGDEVHHRLVRDRALRVAALHPQPVHQGRGGGTVDNPEGYDKVIKRSQKDNSNNFPHLKVMPMSVVVVTSLM